MKIILGDCSFIYLIYDDGACRAAPGYAGFANCWNKNQPLHGWGKEEGGGGGWGKTQGGDDKLDIKTKYSMVYTMHSILNLNCNFRNNKKIYFFLHFWDQ